MRNNSFMCPCCGVEDYTPSTLIMQGNYGSTHDTERVTVKICGECFDKVFESIQRQLPACVMETEFTL